MNSGLRAGDTALVALPGEPFVEGQLRIKLASPTYPTYVAHACSHFAGYVPPREAFERGGHEVQISSWSRLVPEALDTLVEESVNMLRTLFATQGGCRPWRHAQVASGCPELSSCRPCAG
jgi:hypothetical protein